MLGQNDRALPLSETATKLREPFLVRRSPWPLPRRATTRVPGALGFKDKARMKPSQPGTSWALHPPFPVLHGRLAPAKAISEAAAHLILSNALPGGADVTSGRTVSEPKCSRAPRHPRLPRRSLPGQAPPPVTRESRIGSHGCCSQRRQLLPRRVGIAQGRRRRVGDSSWEWGREAGGSRS